MTVPWARNEHGAVTGFKTISYAENVRALAYAREHGAGEAVFPNTRGDLCEATGSNVFLVLAGVLHTPPGETGCLLGVTRALVIELAAELGIPVEERPFNLAELTAATEAFLTSSLRGVAPLVRLDDTTLGSGRPGTLTRQMMSAYAALVERECGA